MHYLKLCTWTAHKCERDGEEEYYTLNPQIQPGAAPGCHIQQCDAEHLWNAANRGMLWSLVQFSEEYRNFCPDLVQFNPCIFLEQI